MLGKRTFGASNAIAKRARTSAFRSIAAATRTSRMSGRYNRRVSVRAGASRETGFVDVASATYGLDTTGSVTLLNTVAQGASVSQRVGKKIMLKSLQARGVMQNNATALLNDVAFLIVYDKRPTGALPSVTDILVSASAQAFNNDANSGRFNILKRCDSNLVGNGTAAGNLTESTLRDADFFLDLKGRATVYKAAGTGAIADIEEGALYLVTVGGNAAGTSAASLVVAFRTRFLDV